MSEVTPTNDSAISATVTNDSLLSAGQTWNNIEGTLDDHNDTWDSPRLGMIKDSAISATVTNDPL